MTNRKDNFSTNERKFGYLMVCRSQLSALLGDNKEQSLLAWLLLYIQFHVFFKQGNVRIGKNTYTCYPGQWITSHLQLSRMSGINRKKVKLLLDVMQSEGWITVRKLNNGFRIILVGYLEQLNSLAIRRVSSDDAISVSDADSFYGKGYID